MHIVFIFVQMHLNGGQWMFLMMDGYDFLENQLHIFLNVGETSLGFFSHTLRSVVFMSVFWLWSTSVVLVCENETTQCHLVTAGDSMACFLECVLSPSWLLSSELLLIRRRPHLLLPNISHIHLSLISYNEGFVGIPAKRNNDRSPKILWFFSLVVMKKGNGSFRFS